MTRSELKYIVSAREVDICWKDIAKEFSISGEACRSRFRRAINRFDELEDRDAWKAFSGFSRRFWSKVFIEEGPHSQCWRWTGCQYKDGYGKFWVGSSTIVASKMAYLLTKGEVPDRQVVRHSCDNKSCCNPSHLTLGTQSDNMHDHYTRKMQNSIDAIYSYLENKN